MRKEAKKQYAVLGLGKFGYSVAITLENMGCDVMVVDNSQEKINNIADSVSFAIRADIGESNVIKSLGARNLDGAIIGVSENMEASIMAAIVAKEVGIPYVIAKAQNELHAKILRKVGADTIIFPEKEMGSRIAKSLVSTNFADLIELSADYSLVEIGVPEKWVGKSLLELNVRQRYDINVIGMIQGDQVEVSLDPNAPMPADCLVIVVGSNKALQKFKELRK